SIPIFPPQRGIGFDSKILSDRRRKSRIHAGSCFISEIAATIFAFSPFSALNTACDGVTKSYLLISPMPVSSGAIKSVAMICPDYVQSSFVSIFLSRAANHLFVLGSHFFFLCRVLWVPFADLFVAFGVQLTGQLDAARLHDPAAEHHMREVRHVVF